MLYIMHVNVRHPITGDTRAQSWQVDPATLDATKMTALRAKILTWCADMDAQAALNNDTAPL